MAREKPPEPPGEDVPVWFMTYSDVITLLMTFFILLLTFATTEPEKFDKVETAAFGTSGATGIAGHIHKRMDNRSWVNRVRPRAARIAMDGSEMPPLMREPPQKAVGKGLETVNDEEIKQDVMSTNSFSVELNPVVSPAGNLTPRGEEISSALANQLRNLPVHCSIQFSEKDNSGRASKFLQYLYEVKGVRPGQVGISCQDDVESGHIRFAIERYKQ